MNATGSTNTAGQKAGREPAGNGTGELAASLGERERVQ
jgi:hypothetical protein